MTDWFSLLKKAKKSCLVNGNLKKVHYDFGNGTEMAEEWNMDLCLVTRRAWRGKKNLGGEPQWDIELGDPDPNYNNDKESLIKEDSTQPFIERRVTKKNLEWRIRNLPYPAETYSVVIDEDKKALIVKTTNKKYYKVLIIPELERLNLVPKQDLVSFNYNKFRTLVITYEKPKELVHFEEAIFKEVKKLKPPNIEDNMDCKPS